MARERLPDKMAAMRVLLLQLDGKLPNLALMRLASHHRQEGDFVYLQQLRRDESVERGLFDDWDSVYASLIFQRSQPLARRLLEIYPDAIVGGTGWNFRTLEERGISTRLDYSDYPSFRASIGFTQRGCRLSCPFCVVPDKEGHVKEEATIQEIWRGEPWPRQLILLDNDFFGQPHWHDRIEEIRAGKFSVSLCQGINARMLSDEAAAALASIDYRNDAMTRRFIHTAWDNIGDEAPLFRGLTALVRHGVKPDNIVVYMLVGYKDTEEDRLYRREQLRAFGCRPYPMPFERTRDLVRFQTWIVGAYDKRVSWEQWKAANGRPEKLGLGVG